MLLNDVILLRTHNMNTIQQSDYQSFVKEIKGIIYEAQYKALKAVNLEYKDNKKLQPRCPVACRMK